MGLASLTRIIEVVVAEEEDTVMDLAVEEGEEAVGAEVIKTGAANFMTSLVAITQGLITEAEVAGVWVETQTETTVTRVLLVMLKLHPDHTAYLLFVYLGG